MNSFPFSDLNLAALRGGGKETVSAHLHWSWNFGAMAAGALRHRVDLGSSPLIPQDWDCKGVPFCRQSGAEKVQAEPGLVIFLGGQECPLSVLLASWSQEWEGN